MLGFLKRARAGLRVENHDPVPTLAKTQKGTFRLKKFFITPNFKIKREMVEKFPSKNLQALKHLGFPLVRKREI